MEIITKDIESIKMYGGNIKVHDDIQIEQIMSSIKKYGFNDPIVIDENNEIIEGHGRFLALKELGYKEVEVIIINNLNEKEKDEYRIVHNHLTMETDFDIRKLDNEIERFDMNLSEFEIEPSVFDWDKIDEIIENMGDKPPKKAIQIKCPFCNEVIEND